MVSITSNIAEVIGRFKKAQHEGVYAVQKTMQNMPRWKARAKELATMTLTQVADPLHTPLIPKFVEKVMALVHEGAMGITLRMTAPNVADRDLSDTGALPQQRMIEQTKEQFESEVFRAAFVADESMAYDTIMDWVASGVKNRAEVDFNPDGTPKTNEQIANAIFAIIFGKQTGDRPAARISLLGTDETQGGHGAGHLRLIDFFAQNPVTRDMPPSMQRDLALMWLSAVLAAWQTIIPKEIGRAAVKEWVGSVWKTV